MGCTNHGSLGFQWFMGLGFRVSGLGVCGFRALGVLVVSDFFFLKNYVPGCSYKVRGFRSPLVPLLAVRSPNLGDVSLNPPPPSGFRGLGFRV